MPAEVEHEAVEVQCAGRDHVAAESSVDATDFRRILMQLSSKLHDAPPRRN